MNHAKSIYCAGLGLLLTVTSNGCLEPTGSTTPKTTVQTRKTIGKTTQNILELEAARQAGGVPASMAITSSGIGVTADAYRTSVGTMAVLAVEQKMQMHRAQFGKLPETYESFMDSIRMTASLARHVRMKFYNPRADGSEPYVDYPEVFNILRGVHYDGIIDIVYEPGRHGGGPIDEVMPRIIRFLRTQIRAGQA